MCDGNSANRRFFKLYSSLVMPEEVYKVNNPFTSEDRQIFFMSDPPYLIKTTRNCWASQKLILWVSKLINNVANGQINVGLLFNVKQNGKEILWKHLMICTTHALHGASTSTPGLSILPHLKYEHVYLISFSKMRVDLAAQVSCSNFKLILI